MKKLTMLLLITILMLSIGCANPINLHTARKYDIEASNAARRGDWKAAQMYYSRAWGNAKMGKAETRDISRVRYEYGRASGVVCDWAEAETALNEAYKLDIQSNGPYWMPLVELERMSIAQKDYTKALKYFDKLIPILKKLNAETIDPLGYADLMDEYALVLEKNNRGTESQQHKNRAKKIRETFPDSKPRTEITPYGTQCKD